MTGYSTRCSVHWFFGGKSAKTSKMSGLISVSSSELAESMFSKSEMSTSFWLRRLNSPAVGIGEHSRVNCNSLPGNVHANSTFFSVNSAEFIARVHLKCCIKRCMTSAMQCRHFSYSETSPNYDGRHGNFTFLKSIEPI